MSFRQFEGFTVTSKIPDYGVNPDTQPAIITCEKCGTWSLREQKYMRDTCEEITCSNCGYKASIYNQEVGSQ